LIKRLQHTKQWKQQWGHQSRPKHKGRHNAFDAASLKKYAYDRVPVYITNANNVEITANTQIVLNRSLTAPYATTAQNYFTWDICNVTKYICLTTRRATTCTCRDRKGKIIATKPITNWMAKRNREVVLLVTAVTGNVLSL